MKEAFHIFVICAAGLASGWIAKDIDCMFNRADVTKPTREPPLAKAQPVPIAGLYRVAGVTDGDDKPYSGIVVILKIEGSQSYYLLYTVGASQYAGVGIKDGDKLSVGWAMEGKGGQKINGVTVYDIGDGVLSGRYTTIPLSSGKETLKRIPD